jgi:hypothetical protein
MSQVDALPADQRATLQLLLKQGKSYAELATLLRLEPTAVRERALDALDSLGPETPAGLDAARQDELSDYLLGQQSASQRAATRDFLEGSAGGRAWARVVAGELRSAGLAGDDDLPEIPADRAEADEAFDALDARREARARNERSSRLGGVLLLGVVGIAVAVALILLIGGGSDDSSSSSTPSTPAQTSTQSTNAQAAGLEQQINMTSTSSDAVAVGFVLKQGNRRALGIQGQNFPQTDNSRFFYAVWLKGPSGSKRIGFVNTGVGKDGKLQTGADPDSALQSAKTTAEKNAARDLQQTLAHIYDYDQMLITKETRATQNSTTPGEVVVSGAIRPPGQGGTGTTG